MTEQTQTYLADLTAFVEERRPHRISLPFDDEPDREPPEPARWISGREADRAADIYYQTGTMA